MKPLRIFSMTKSNKYIYKFKRVDSTINVFFRRYCPECRNDASEVVLAGEKLKESKKKAKMASASSSSQRDWGKVRFRRANTGVGLVQMKCL